MSDSNKHTNSTNSELDINVITERVENLPWPQRKLPQWLVNPCLRKFQEIGKIMFDLHDNGKIKKIILEHGTGDVLPFNSFVYLHYTCYLDGSKAPFDGSISRSLRPQTCQMGGGFLFAGFEIALSSMRKGETAQFLVHPDYAFRKMGAPPRIPGNAFILFVVYVLDYIDCGYAILKNKQMESGSFCDKIKIAKSHNALGMDYYNQGKIKSAFHHFREAQLSIDEKVDDNSEEQQRLTSLRTIFINQLMCLSHDEYYKPNILLDVAEKAKEVLPDLPNTSAKYNCALGIAYMHLQEFNSAAGAFKKAQQLSPLLPRLCLALKSFHEMVGKCKNTEKQLWKDVFKKLGYTPLPNEPKPISEEEIRTRKYVNDILTKSLNKKNFTIMNLGTGLNKTERKILSEEAEKLGLLYEEYLQKCYVCVELKKPKSLKPIL